MDTTIDNAEEIEINETAADTEEGSIPLPREESKAPAAPADGRVERLYGWLDRVPLQEHPLVNEGETFAGSLIGGEDIYADESGVRWLVLPPDQDCRTVKLRIVEPAEVQLRAIYWISHWSWTLGKVIIVREGDDGDLMLAAGAIGHGLVPLNTKKLAVRLHKRFAWPTDEGMRVQELQALIEHASWPVVSPRELHAALIDGRVEMPGAAALHAYTGRQWVDPMSIDLNEAYQAFTKAMSGFGFVDRRDLCTAVTMLVHAGLWMNRLKESPLYVINGVGGIESSGSGKSYLCELAGVLAAHSEIDAATWATHDPYALFGVFNRRDPVILIDNVASNTHIPEDPELLVIVSQRRAVLRAARQTQSHVDARHKIIAMTGNNLAILGEQARRVAVCRLMPVPRSAVEEGDDGLPGWDQPVERLIADVSGRSTAVLLRALAHVAETDAPAVELSAEHLWSSRWCQAWQSLARRVAAWAGSAWGTASDLGRSAGWQAEWDALRERCAGTPIATTDVVAAIRADAPALLVHLGLTTAATERAALTRAGAWVREHAGDGGWQCHLGASKGRTTYLWTRGIVASTVDIPICTEDVDEG